MFAEFPNDIHTFTLEDQWMVSDVLLVKPITDSGHTHASVYLPGPTAWYDLFTLRKVDASKPGEKTSIDAPIETMPVFMKAGKILSRKMRLRRSSKLMHADPYSITIAPDSTGKALGSLYMDDETSMAHESHGMYVYREFTYADKKLVCSAKKEDMEIESKIQGLRVRSAQYEPTNILERIDIADQHEPPRKVYIAQSDGLTVTLPFGHNPQTNVVTIRKPNVRVAENWIISFEY
jgi:alpha 1,3-glucosidase